MRTSIWIGGLLLASLVGGGVVGVAPDPALAGPVTMADYEAKKRKILLEAGQRHLKIGVWLRDQGMVPQATSEFMRAVELSESRHPGTVKVLNMMQTMDEAFWKKRRRKPHMGLLDAYDKRLGKALKKYQKERLGLATWAWKKKFPDQALSDYRTILTAQDRALEFDAKGRLVLDAGTIPTDASERIKSEAITINDKLYVRDAFLEKLPDVTSIFEVESDTLRVRSMVSKEQAQDLLALGEALIPQLAEQTGGRPTRRMNLFVFRENADWKAYLDAAKLSQHKVAAGLAISSSFVALVDAGGRSEEAVRGIALHELSHLFMFGVTRCVMPSWYSEGFAETYGGTGTFTWQDGKLTLGGKMGAFRVDPLKQDDGYIPLKILLGGNALVLLSKDKDKAHRFYAESWAFVRFMREGAGEDMLQRFELWETMCRGKGLGAQLGKLDANDATPSGQLFQEMFSNDYAALDTQFQEFVKGL